MEIEKLPTHKTIKKIEHMTPEYKLSSRKYHPKDTVCNNLIGSKKFTIIVAPNKIQSEKHFNDFITKLTKLGISFFSDKHYRSSCNPYGPNNSIESTVKIFSNLKKFFDVSIISEITNINHINFYNDVDILEIGSNNMQNFELLKELGNTDKTILLRRGNGNTIKELLLSAEYIMNSGNENVILCDQGIRTFAKETINSFDICSIPLLKHETHLPVITDPCISCETKCLVHPLTLSSFVAGANGVILNVHDKKNNLSNTLANTFINLNDLIQIISFIHNSKI